MQLRAQTIKCAKSFLGRVITVSQSNTDLINIRCQNLTVLSAALILCPVKTII